MSRLLKPLVALMLGAVISAAAPLGASAQTPTDTSAIRQAALDYIEGYYAADAERVERALHPALRKRMVYTHPRTRADSLNRQTAQTLIQGTRQRDPTPDDQRRAEVQILDIYKDAASVRIDAQGWVDYLHVARWRGDWKIVNVLWELRQQPTAAR
jgi:hypothetical protein